MDQVKAPLLDDPEAATSKPTPTPTPAPVPSRCRRFIQCARPSMNTISFLLVLATYLLMCNVHSAARNCNTTKSDDDCTKAETLASNAVVVALFAYLVCLASL